MRLSKEQVDAKLRDLGFDGTIRAETLSVEDHLRRARCLDNCKFVTLPVDADAPGGYASPQAAIREQSRRFDKTYFPSPYSSFHSSYHAI